MFTPDNTAGFTAEQITKLNARAAEIMADFGFDAEDAEKAKWADDRAFDELC